MEDVCQRILLRIAFLFSQILSILSPEIEIKDLANLQLSF